MSAARAQDVWTVYDKPGVDVASASRGAYLVLMGDSSRDRTRSAVVRVAVDGSARRMARLPGWCTSIAALVDGGAVVACDRTALLRVRADGGWAPLAVPWPVDVQVVTALAAVPGGLLVSVFSNTPGAEGGYVFRVGDDGSVVGVAGGGTHPAATNGMLATSLRLGSIEGLAADGAGFVFAHVGARGVLVRRVSAQGTVTTLAGGGRRAPLHDGLPARSVRIENDLDRMPLAVLPGGDILLSADFSEPRTLLGRVVRVDAESGRLQILATPELGVGFNYGDGRPLMRATLGVLALAAGADGDVAIVDADRGLRWLDAPRASRLAVAVTATRASAPAVWLHATHRARMTVTVRHRGQTVRRLQARGPRATLALGWLRTGEYAIRVTATDAQGRFASDEVPLVIGRNPIAFCDRVSDLRVDCLFPATSDDADEGYVVVLRPDGQLWQGVDPFGQPGDPIPRNAVWSWLREP